jgi:hypothetical protein
MITLNYSDIYIVSLYNLSHCSTYQLHDADHFRLSVRFICRSTREYPRCLPVCRSICCKRRVDAFVG